VTDEKAPREKRKKKSEDAAAPTSAARAGRAAIVGRPNAGKSTLLNALLGQKLVIATPTPGTTRTSVLAVYQTKTPPTQIAFIDTPGLHRPKSALGKVLVDEARAGLAEASVVLFLVEAPAESRGQKKVNLPATMHPEDEPVLALAKDAGVPIILVVTKIDRLKDKRFLLPFIALYQAAHDFAAIVPISSVRGENLDALVAEIRERLPEGLLYDAEFFTDRPERFFVAELVREAAIEQVRAEVPHGLACTIDEYSDEPKIVRIKATLVVEKDSHKGIVVGAGGQRIKAIGTAARHQIEAFLERKVHLDLWVKVIVGWTGKPNEAKRLATEVERT
jgi:GTP-binding protein Era